MTDLDNLLINLAMGLPPESLSKDEMKMLEDKYGPDWFGVLGYEKPDWKRPGEKNE